jgi:hypothetical protein
LIKRGFGMKKALVAVALAILMAFSAACGQTSDSYEPNNEIGDAKELNLSVPVSSSIYPPGDVDFFKVYVDSPGIMQAQVSNAPKEMKSRIDLFGKNYNWITRKDAENPGDAIVLSFDAAKAGWYFFAVSDLVGGSYASDYSFMVSFEPVVDHDPNSELGDATEISVGQDVKGNIFPAGDVDFYKVCLNSTGILQASLTNVPQSVAASMKGRIDLFGKNFNWITRKDAENPADNVVLTIDIGAPGCYYFGISDLAGGSYNMTYDLRVDLKPVVDEEPNGELGDSTLLQMGQEIRAFTFPAGDVDFYKVYIDKPGTIKASLDSVPKSTKVSMKGRIDLFGKNFNWITRKDAEKPGDSVALQFDIPTAGWYYFGISDLNGGSYDVEYVFRVS